MALGSLVASAANVGTTASTTITGTEPSGTAQNDVVWAFFIVESSSGETCGLPSGWTTLASRTGGTHNFNGAFGRIIRGATAPSYAFSCSNTGRHYELLIWKTSGDDLVNVEDGTATTVDTGTLQSTNVDPAAVTVNFASDWVLVMMSDWRGSPTGGWGAPTGYTSISDSGTGNAAAAAYKAVSGTGTEDPGVFSATGSGSDYQWAVTQAIRAASGGGGGGIVSPLQTLGPSYAAQRAARI